MPNFTRAVVSTVIILVLVVVAWQHLRWENGRDRHSLTTVFAEHHDVPTSFKILDMTGDGMPEVVQWTSAGRFIIANHVDVSDPDNWSFNGYFHHNMKAKYETPCLFADINGDGLKEFFVRCWDSDSTWGYAMDLNGNRLADFEGVRGVDKDTRPGWDGHLIPGGVYNDPVAGETRMVARITTGYDMEPRDVRVYRMPDTRPVWVKPIGAYMSQIDIGDLDGDGNPDFLILGTSTGNSGSAGGFDASHSYLIAMRSNGSIMWADTLGGEYSTSRQVVLDDPDLASIQIVGFVDTGRGSEARAGRALLIDPANGSVIDSLTYTGQLEQSVVLHRMPDGSGWYVFTTTNNGVARRFAVKGGRITLTAERQVSKTNVVFGSVHDDPDYGLVVSGWDYTGRIFLLDDEFNTLTVHPDMEGGADWPLPVFSDTLGHHYWAVGNDRGDFEIARLSKAPYPWLPRSAFALAYLLLLSGLVIALRWRPQIRLMIPSVKDLSLWMEVGNHGRPAPWKRIQDLREEIDGLVVQDEIKAMQLETLRDHSALFLEFHFPAFEQVELFVKGNPNDYPEHDELGHTLEGLRQNLELLSSESTGTAEIKSRGPVATGLITRALELTKNVVCQFAEHNTLDLNGPLEYAVRECMEAIDDSGIELIREGDWPEDRYIWGRPDEILFVIDNLISNAVHSMKHTDTRRLTIRRLTQPGIRRLYLEVEDTGKGIPEELHERIFDAGFTTREGGTGIGLGRSREIMAEWRGAITLAKSVPGRGSVFRVEFVELQDKEIEAWLKNRRNHNS